MTDIPLAPVFSFPASDSLSASPHFFPMTVQEYLPVVHRLRLSASPYAPTSPEQISFTLDTLDIRPEGFSPSSRYSFRHSLFNTVHGSLQYRFAPYSLLLYRCTLHPIASVVCFSPGHFRRRASRLVSYYALFECVAASEPTSWLSWRSHILFHLTRTLGP